MGKEFGGICRCDYKIETLVDLLAEHSLASSEKVELKLHKKYFDEYFSHPNINAQVIIVEKEYIDHDYLEDFSAYYVRCFQPYKRYTTRLHFFNIQFTQHEFENALASDSNSKLTVKKLKDAYLGFIVVKFLPETIIGRTCLKTYGETDGRKFPALRTYNANLCGVEFTVQSLAFQEQDKVVAACATSALWSCLQATGKLFHHPIPAPVEITRSATAQVVGDHDDNQRPFPSSGLVPIQMSLAIHSTGLESQIVRSDKRSLLCNNIHAYLSCRIPVVLVFNMGDIKDDKPVLGKGKHAVTVSGYRLGEGVQEDNDDFQLSAARIEKIFVHDDRVGPFARMEFISDTDATWLSVSSKDGKTQCAARPSVLVCPLHSKIRIPFEVIHDAIERIDEQMRVSRKKGFHPLKPEWDIHLTTTSDFKHALRDRKFSSFDKSKRLQLLKASLPRFLWRVTIWHDNSPHLDLLFDATGIRQGKLLVATLAASNTPFPMYFNELSYGNSVEDPLAQDILDYFKAPTAS